MRPSNVFALVALAGSLCAGSVARAAAPPSDGPPPDGKPEVYAKFTAGLTPVRGLLTIWPKDGKLYIEVGKDQLDTDFIQTAVPSSGLGGYGVTPGLPYVQFARIMRFSRVDDKIVVSWPNTSFVAPDGSAAARAIQANFAPSILATEAIAAKDDASGKYLFDASFLLGDVIDMQNYLRVALNSDRNPATAYHLDPARSFFGRSKAFPENVVLEADQTFASTQPDAVDNVTDARSIQVKIAYNIAKAPAAGSYVPRIADDRVGYYPDIQLDYGRDDTRDRRVRYITRWNLARHPMTYYIANDVPQAYRDTIKAALLTWNDAFAKIGIPHAVEVLDQPADPAWDADDIRYSTVHWLTLSGGGGYAQAGLVWDPRTGELIKTSIVIDADLVAFGNREGADFVGPTRATARAGGFGAREAAFAAEAKAAAAFGLDVLRARGDAPIDGVPPGYTQDFLRAIVLHESGHNWGLQHNFIGSQAYTAKELQSKTFTSTYGVANSVMEYAPVNVWPKGTPNGDFFQLVLGPYDYYAIKWGYAPIAGATTPDAEEPTLRSWASVWSDPRYRFAMDEDVDFESGHAIDPRVAQFDLTNDNIGWCDAQLRIGRELRASLERRAWRTGDTHDAMRQAFGAALRPAFGCAVLASHYTAGEYLSRAHVGDPNASLPLAPVSRAESRRAFALLEDSLIGADAWHLSPTLLRKLVYTEWVTDLPQPTWAYDPPVRHDVPIGTMVAEVQHRILDAMFHPVVLQRLDDAPLKYAPGAAMSLADAFDWTQAAIFGDLTSPREARADAVHRSLQLWYAHKLATLAIAPPDGTPDDAQSLARAELMRVRADVHRAPAARAGDALTRAHLIALANVVEQALTARTIVPAATPSPK